MNGAINESVTHLQLVKGQNCRSEMVSSAIHVLVWDFMGKLRFTHLPFDGLRFSFSIRDLKINIFKHFRLVNCSDQARWVYPSHQLCQWNRTNQPISSSLTQSLSRQRNERIIIRDRNYELKKTLWSSANHEFIGNTVGFSVMIFGFVSNPMTGRTPMNSAPRRWPSSRTPAALTLWGRVFRLW